MTDRGPGIAMDPPERIFEAFYTTKATGLGMGLSISRTIVEAHQAAYAESAAEDAEACARLHRGRRALWLAGEDDAGPYQTPHEDGVIHMHDWIRRELAPRLPA